MAWFSFITWRRLRARHARRPLPLGENYLGVGFKQLRQTFREARRYPETLKFLAAYFLYNDGIQTIIIVAANFATAPIARGGLALGQETLTGVILMIQIVAFAGALLWERLACRIGPKRAILVSLLIWVGVVVYSYVGLRSQNLALEFAILGAFIALVLGGSQAISRSLFSQLIPVGKEAEFYSFYEVSDRGTSSIGPFLFGIVNQALGSYRPAILSLIFFFAAGLVRANVAYIYLLGEFWQIADTLDRCIKEMEGAGLLGDNIFGTDYTLRLYTHLRAGAYICGEVTAMLESLEGKLGQPRLRPPFPPSFGLYGKPTIVNNVETLTNVPPIIARGADWYHIYGSERSPGVKIFSLSGCINRPGNYELPLGTTFRELIYTCGGGLPEGRKIKAIMPAGASPWET